MLQPIPCLRLHLLLLLLLLLYLWLLRLLQLQQSLQHPERSDGAHGVNAGP